MANRNHINVISGINVLVLVFLVLVFMNSCKDEEKAFELSVSSLVVFQNDVAEVIVKGGGQFEISFTDPLVANATVDGNIVRIKGLRIGTTQLSVTKSNGEVRACSVIVKENQDDTDLTDDDVTRIEWGSSCYYPEEKEGFIFSTFKGINALGMVDDPDVITFDFSILGDESNWFRANVSGNLSSAGDLTDGLIVVQQNGKAMQSFIAKKVVLKAAQNGKKYLIFYLPDDLTVRVVTPVME